MQWVVEQAARLQEAVDRFSQPRQHEPRPPPPTLAWAHDMAMRIDVAIVQAKMLKKEDKRRRAKPERPQEPMWLHPMAGQIAIAVKDVERRRDGSQQEPAITEPERPEAPSWLVEVSVKVEQTSVSYASRLEIKEAKTPSKTPPEWLVEMVEDFDFAFETYAAPLAPVDPAELEIDVSAPAWLTDAGRQLGRANERLRRRTHARPAPTTFDTSLPWWIADAASRLEKIVRNLQKSARPVIIDDPRHLWKTGTWHDLPGWGRDAYQRLGTVIARLERRLDGFKRLEPKQPAVPGWMIQAACALDWALGPVEEKLELEVFEPSEQDTWAERVLLGLQSDKSIEDLLNAAPNLAVLRRRLKNPRPTRFHPDRQELKPGQTFVYGLLQPKKIDERDAAGKRHVYFVDQGVGRSCVNQRELRSVEWRVFDPTIGFPIVRAKEITRGMDAYMAQQEEFYFRLDSSSKLGAEPLQLQAIPEGEPRDVPWVNPQTGRTEMVTFSRYLELEAEGKAGSSAELHAKMQIT